MCAFQEQLGWSCRSRRLPWVNLARVSSRGQCLFCTITWGETHAARYKNTKHGKNNKKLWAQILSSADCRLFFCYSSILGWFPEILSPLVFSVDRCLSFSLFFWLSFLFCFLFPSHVLFSNLILVGYFFVALPTTSFILVMYRVNQNYVNT